MTSANLSKYPDIYMPCPFAGDADSSSSSGTNRSKPFSNTSSAANVNMRTGFPTVFSQALSANGRYLARPDMNQLGYLATVGQFRKQSGCLNEYNTTFASAVTGYPKGAVLDFPIVKKGVIKEVWKIVSLSDNNSYKPTESNIVIFGKDVDSIPSNSKWMRVSPDYEYCYEIMTECKTYAEGLVNTEASDRKNADDQRILTTTAVANFASGRNTSSDEGCNDGTALDASKNETMYSDPKKVTVKYGHIHTNIYTKQEVDDLISESSGIFANVTKGNKDGYDGTYLVDTQKYGHQHRDYALGRDYTIGSTRYYDSTDGTAYDIYGGYCSKTGRTIYCGHVHKDYATTEWVYSVLPASGDTAKYEGDSSSFAITIGSILIQGGIINIAPSAKEYWRSTFTFKKTFKVSPVVIGQFSASPFFKNMDGVSNVYVDTITNTSCNVVYDNAGYNRIGYAHIVAFGIA